MNVNKTQQFACLFGLLTALYLPNGLSANDDEAKQAREQLLQGMRMRAQQTNVSQFVGGKRVVCKPAAQPLIRFSDQPRDIMDATLWAIGTPGRPVALQKIEVYHRPEGPSWFYCMTSLSESLIETRWRDGQTWSSRKPGTEFRELAKGPRPAATEVARLSQMKQIARRFDCILYEKPSEQRTVLRALKTPLYRYADPANGIRDGAIFGFAFGTNPDALLSIELHGDDATGLKWRYGLARITLCQVTVNLDDNQVWTVPYVYPQGPGKPSKFDTWLFFYEGVVNE